MNFKTGDQVRIKTIEQLKSDPQLNITTIDSEKLIFQIKETTKSCVIFQTSFKRYGDLTFTYEYHDDKTDKEYIRCGRFLCDCNIHALTYANNEEIDISTLI